MVTMENVTKGLDSIRTMVRETLLSGDPDHWGKLYRLHAYVTEMLLDLAHDANEELQREIYDATDGGPTVDELEEAERDAQAEQEEAAWEAEREKRQLQEANANMQAQLVELCNAKATLAAELRTALNAYKTTSEAGMKAQTDAFKTRQELQASQAELAKLRAAPKVEAQIAELTKQLDGWMAKHAALGAEQTKLRQELAAQKKHWEHVAGGLRGENSVLRDQLDFLRRGIEELTGKPLGRRELDREMRAAIWASIEDYLREHSKVSDPAHLSQERPSDLSR